MSGSVLYLERKKDEMAGNAWQLTHKECAAFVTAETKNVPGYGDCVLLSHDTIEDLTPGKTKNQVNKGPIKDHPLFLASKRNYYL